MVTWLFNLVTKNNTDLAAAGHWLSTLVECRRTQWAVHKLHVLLYTYTEQQSHSWTCQLCKNKQGSFDFIYTYTEQQSHSWTCQLHVCKNKQGSLDFISKVWHSYEAIAMTPVTWPLKRCKWPKLKLSNVGQLNKSQQTSGQKSTSVDASWAHHQLLCCPYRPLHCSLTPQTLCQTLRQLLTHWHLLNLSIIRHLGLQYM